MRLNFLYMALQKQLMLSREWNNMEKNKKLLLISGTAIKTGNIQLILNNPRAAEEIPDNI